MNILVYTVIISTILLVKKTTSDENITRATTQFDKAVDETAFKVLSRKKRFLIFPDGSSFQIVFCTQNHGYLQIGNIVWFGTTAALAWELPTDPGAFDIIKNSYRVPEGKRRSDILYYVDEDGKVVDKIEYKRKILINPAFAKRSVNTAEINNNNFPKVNKKEMHNSQKNKILFKDLDTTRLQLHRTERQKLYVKMEKFLQTLGWNGKECILKMLCLTAKEQTNQKSFVGEILRAVFTLPAGPGTASELHKQYDDARGDDGNCSERYPKCGHVGTV
ncbi:hypothetical protein B5X24_HaOG206318 [Helicoverpa armigera]|nr:hypothetical protein B5X24_HaOG206318 [Helicoverpa armigera]